MELTLHDRIYQRVKSEVNNDDQFCTYLAEICTDQNSHADDLRDIIDTMVKTSYANISETRRQHLIYALLDMIEDDRRQQAEGKPTEDEGEDEIDLAEQLERDGDCKLCGCTQRITSESLALFAREISSVDLFSSSSHSQIDLETHEKLGQRIGQCFKLSHRSVSTLSQWDSSNLATYWASERLSNSGYDSWGTRHTTVSELETKTRANSMNRSSFVGWPSVIFSINLWNCR